MRYIRIPCEPLANTSLCIIILLIYGGVQLYMHCILLRLCRYSFIFNKTVLNFPTYSYILCVCLRGVFFSPAVGLLLASTQQTPHAHLCISNLYHWTKDLVIEPPKTCDRQHRISSSRHYGCVKVTLCLLTQTKVIPQHNLYSSSFS